MNNGLARADYLIVVAFFLVMLGVGVYFANRMRNLKDFFSGGHRVPWWVSGVSLYMTSFSAFAFVAYSAIAYQYGFVAIAIWWTGVPCWIISARFFAARWRRAATTSPVEYIETRYGPVLRQGFAWEGVPLIVIDDALKLFVIGKMVTVSLGLSDPRLLMLAIVVCGTIMLAYTFMGGLWAVMVTDFVQFVIMGVVVVILIPLVLARLDGFSRLFEDAPEGFWAPTGGSYTAFWVGSFCLVQLLSYTTKWPLVQRYYAVESDAEARKVGYTVAALTFFGAPLLFFPGLAARIFMPDIADANAVYPLLCKALLPVGMVGMMIAAMFSATMSMLSGDYNAVASVITNDIYKRLFRRHASEKSLVLAGRLFTLLVGVIAIGVALLLASFQEREDLVKIMVQVFSVLAPPVAIPMMFGLLTRRVSNAGGLAGFISGAACGITAYVLSYALGMAFLRESQYVTWITAAPTLVMMLLFSAWLPDSVEKRQRIDRFLEGLSGKTGPDRTAQAVRESSEAATVAIRIIGWSAAAMGGLLTGSVLLTVPLSEGRLSLLAGGAMFAMGMVTVAWATRLRS